MIITIISILIMILSSSNGNDFSTTQFTIEGRLNQIEYATKTTIKGSSIIATHNNDISILLLYKGDMKSNRLIKEQSYTDVSIKKLSNNIGCGSTGISSDINYLINKLFEAVINHETVFDSSVPVIRITNNLASYIHSRTMTSKYRPFGIRLCIIGYDKSLGSLVLDIDALGNKHQNKLCCLGPRAQKLNNIWGKVDPIMLSTSELMEKLVNTLETCLIDEKIKLNSNDISIALVGKDKPFTILTRDEVIEILENKKFSSLFNNV